MALPDPDATRSLGAVLARACSPGTIVLLHGPLGAGKTTLVDGFIAAAGGGRATSPTFVIAHEHAGGKIPIWHLDLYRMEDERQVSELDLPQYMSESAITLCEWAERAPGVWPPDVVTVVLQLAGQGRRATLRAGGTRSRAVLDVVRKSLPELAEARE
jgi:tRNA threonylcarbamoyladenosine biosynthesis protein TsaE